MNQNSSNAAIQLARLRLRSPNITAQRGFYKDLLGLPITADAKDALTIRSTASEITFTEAPSVPAPAARPPYYHFAFNIPENQINEALEWTKARVPIVKNREGNEIVFFESWNAHALYFFDPAGNIVEFIARHTLPNASTKPFGPDSILEASEIGLVVPDVAAAVTQVTRDLGAAPYRTPSDEFASMGDERGLLIIVRTGRKWFMAEHLAAEPFETDITLRGSPPRSCTLPGLPYSIHSA